MGGREIYHQTRRDSNYIPINSNQNYQPNSTSDLSYSQPSIPSNNNLKIPSRTLAPLSNVGVRPNSSYNRIGSNMNSLYNHPTPLPTGSTGINQYQQQPIAHPFQLQNRSQSNPLVPKPQPIPNYTTAMTNSSHPHPVGSSTNHQTVPTNLRRNHSQYRLPPGTSYINGRNPSPFGVPTDGSIDSFGSRRNSGQLGFSPNLYNDRRNSHHMELSSNSIDSRRSSVQMGFLPNSIDSRRSSIQMMVTPPNLINSRRNSGQLGLPPSSHDNGSRRNSMQPNFDDSRRNSTQYKIPPNFNVSRRSSTQLSNNDSRENSDQMNSSYNLSNRIKPNLPRHLPDNRSVNKLINSTDSKRNTHQINLPPPPPPSLSRIKHNNPSQTTISSNYSNNQINLPPRQPNYRRHSNQPELPPSLSRRSSSQYHQTQLQPNQLKPNLPNITKFYSPEDTDSDCNDEINFHQSHTGMDVKPFITKSAYNTINPNKNKNTTTDYGTREFKRDHQFTPPSPPPIMMVSNAKDRSHTPETLLNISPSVTITATPTAVTTPTHLNSKSLKPKKLSRHPSSYSPPPFSPTYSYDTYSPLAHRLYLTLFLIGLPIFPISLLGLLIASVTSRQTAITSPYRDGPNPVHDRWRRRFLILTLLWLTLIVIFLGIMVVKQPKWFPLKVKFFGVRH